MGLLLQFIENDLSSCMEVDSQHSDQRLAGLGNTSGNHWLLDVRGQYHQDLLEDHHLLHHQLYKLLMFPDSPRAMTLSVHCTVWRVWFGAQLPHTHSTDNTCPQKLPSCGIGHSYKNNPTHAEFAHIGDTRVQHCDKCEVHTGHSYCVVRTVHRNHVAHIVHTSYLHHADYCDCFVCL